MSQVRRRIFLICPLLIAVVALGLSGARVLGGESARSAAARSSLALARQVDALLAARWKSEGVQPAELTDDSAFMRRAYLDLIGVIPTAGEAREFLDDARPDKREELIDRLLNSPAHATHLADVWRHLMLPGKFDQQQAAGIIGLQNWLRRQFADRRRYDRIVADLLVATGADDAGPTRFYTALGLKPEELGATTARIFLGLRLDCAQCHNHPFEHWTQQDFWGYAAFFGQLQQRTGSGATMRLVDVAAGDVRLPDTQTIVPPRYLEGALVEAGETGTRRQQLAIWMVSRDNPYLPRATVNLVWAQLFGRGLVEPLDDFGKHNPASHPEVLDALADGLVANAFDLDWLFRTLANTRAYQLASEPPAGCTDVRDELFHCMAIKTLSGEQFFDSLARVSLRPATMGQDRLADPARQAFLIKMQTQTPTNTDFELNVPQALTLMNGPDLDRVTDAEQSSLLAALEAPFLTDHDRIRALFLATLTRLPRGDELAEFLEPLHSTTGAERGQVLGDLVWALLNSADFALNR